MADKVSNPQASFNSLMETVKLAKPMAEAAADAYIGRYPDPTQRSTQIGSVSTQTLGSVPIFGSGAPVVPIENIDKMYLLQQQAKLRQKAEDDAIMGEVKPYYELATATSSKKFNALVNLKVQGEYTKAYASFAGKPNAEVNARKAVAADTGFHTALADYTSFQKQFNSLYQDSLVFMGMDPTTKDGKASGFIPPSIRTKLNSFVNIPESLLESAEKTGSFDLTEASKQMDNIRLLLRPMQDVSVSVKTYVDELAATVNETLPKKIRSTNQADLMVAIKKEYFDANPEEYAERIMQAHYADLPEEDKAATKSMIAKMVDDQISTKITNTASTMSNGFLQRAQWEYEKKKEMPIQTTQNIGYTVKDAQGRQHARRVTIPDFVPTQQKPIQTSFTGNQMLYDPSTNTYIMPAQGVSTQATVSGVGTFKKHFGTKEADIAVTAFGGGNPWNGRSNQVNGHVAVMTLGTPKDQQVRESTQVPTGETVKTATGKKSLLTTVSSRQRQTIKARVFDPSTGAWSSVDNYDIEGKTFMTDSRNVISNVATTDRGMALWLDERNGQVPSSAQFRTEKAAPTE